MGLELDAGGFDLGLTWLKLSLKDVVSFAGAAKSPRRSSSGIALD
jgi:hypothetical protein